MVAKGQGEGAMESFLIVMECHFCRVKTILEMGCTAVSVLYTPELYSSKWLQW